MTDRKGAVPLLAWFAPEKGVRPLFVTHFATHSKLLNVRVDKAVAVAKTKLTVMVDLDNALNSHPVTNVNLLNDDFEHVIAVLNPRAAKVGLRLTF
jgi:hypothetical protein